MRPIGSRVGPRLRGTLAAAHGPVEESNGRACLGFALSQSGLKPIRQDRFPQFLRDAAGKGKGLKV